MSLKKLSLKKDTLLSLSEQDASYVAGGRPPRTEPNCLPETEGMITCVDTCERTVCRATCPVTQCNTCENTCKATCNTCNTKCNQVTCATCATNCNQYTCRTCDAFTCDAAECYPRTEILRRPCIIYPEL